MSATSSAVNLRRLIVSVYLLVFLSLVAGSGMFFWQTRQEYNRLLHAEALARLRVTEAKNRLREQELVLQRLRNDSAYVEMVIRKRLRYAKPGERIYLFPGRDTPAVELRE